MIRLLLILTLIFLLAMLIHQLKKYFTRDKKEEELRDTFIEGDLADIELEIAEEKVRQEEVRKAAQQLNSKDNTNKEIDNE